MTPAGQTARPGPIEEGMRARNLAWLMLLAAACSRQPEPREPRPPVWLVNRIEAQLARHPCIGALDRWDRRYYHARDLSEEGRARGLSRTDIVRFDLMEGGLYHYRAGRVIGTFDVGADLDERQMRMAFGEYRVRGGQLVVQVCGWNQNPGYPWWPGIWTLGPGS